MKKIILALAIVVLTSSLSFAQTIDPLAAVQAKKAAVENNLEARRAEAENRIKAHQEETLARIDEQIAKAKEAGRPTDKLEQKRQKIIEHIAQREERLNARINAQKAKLN